MHASQDVRNNCIPAPPLKIAISINTCWNFLNFRAGLIRALIVTGNQVLAIAPVDETLPRVRALGCRFVQLEMDGKGTSPINDLRLIFKYRSILKVERPDVYISYTIKPNIYGSLAAHSLGIPVINNISGLGTAFLRRGWLNWIVRLLYRITLRRSHTVFFQNIDDRDLFIKLGLVPRATTGLLPGSGIDLLAFRPEHLDGTRKGPPVFLMVARLLVDKGVKEYVDAARLVRKSVPDATFRLLGFLNVQNPGAISADAVAAWEAEGVIEFLGDTDDVRPHIAAADCIVLPSYYPEGLPRTLLEGAAMGKPLITTDTPGCREMIEEGKNGFFCAVRDSNSLAQAVFRIIALSERQRIQMGVASRAKVEEFYDEQIVIDRYQHAISRAISKSPMDD